MTIPWTTVDAAVAAVLMLRALGEYILAYHLAPRRLRALADDGGTASMRVRDYWVERRRRVIEGRTVARNSFVAGLFILILIWRIARG